MIHGHMYIQEVDENDTHAYVYTGGGIKLYMGIWIYRRWNKKIPGHMYIQEVEQNDKRAYVPIQEVK
jgi:hypothetical protein